tara:strand:+ start:107 stop:457 length:351 start_codon:yes stop_codon:yes gene_type:complete
VDDIKSIIGAYNKRENKTAKVQIMKTLESFKWGTIVKLTPISGHGKMRAKQFGNHWFVTRTMAQIGSVFVVPVNTCQVKSDSAGNLHMEMDASGNNGGRWVELTGDEDFRIDFAIK